MQLQFLNLLSEEQIKELINYVNSEDEYAHTTRKIRVLCEPDRQDENGYQEILVNAWDDNFHIGNYFIQDFNIKESFSLVDVSKLRIFMASIFGEEYLEALRGYFAMEAEKEIARIKSTLGVGRS